MALIRLETPISASCERVFDLARDVDLHARGAEATGERAIAGVTSGLVELGDTITWRAKHLGVWQELTVSITEFDAPHLFVDAMTRGAFKRMRHLHRFVPTDEGTLMIDEFEFVAPYGPLGWLSERLFLIRYMRRFLLHRNAFLKAQAEDRESVHP